MKRTQTLVKLGRVALLLIWMAAACGRATPTAPSLSVEERFKKANEFAQQGEFQKAIAEYEAILQEDPDNVSVLTNLGVAYYQVGQLDNAIAWYQKALSLAPKDADIHSNLAAAYVQSNQLDKALGEYLTAVQLNPNLAEAHFGLGVVYLQQGDKDKAIEAFEQFQALDTGLDPRASDQARQYLQQLKGE